MLRCQLLDLPRLDVARDALDLAPHAQQVAAPDLADLLLGVAATHELERDVERLRRAVPAVDAAAAVEVGRDADVIDADLLDEVVDVIDEVLDGRRAASAGYFALIGQRAACRTARGAPARAPSSAGVDAAAAAAATAAAATAAAGRRRRSDPRRCTWAPRPPGVRRRPPPPPPPAARRATGAATTTAGSPTAAATAGRRRLGRDAELLVSRRDRRLTRLRDRILDLARSSRTRPSARRRRSS